MLAVARSVQASRPRARRPSARAIVSAMLPIALGGTYIVGAAVGVACVVLVVLLRAESREEAEAREHARGDGEGASGPEPPGPYLPH